MATAAEPGITRLDLGGVSWQLHPTDKPADVTPATVPGCVDTDLMAAGRLPADPYFRTNESLFQDAAKTAWTYERHVDVPAELLARRHVELRCEGIETLAHVTVNGHKVGDTDNMFRTWRFDVRPLLHAGTNTIAVAFDPIQPYIAARVAAAKGSKTRLLAIKGMGEVRVEPCVNGWDFGPKFITYGLWKTDRPGRLGRRPDRRGRRRRRPGGRPRGRADRRRQGRHRRHRRGGRHGARVAGRPDGRRRPGGARPGRHRPRDVGRARPAAGGGPTAWAITPCTT